MTESNLSYVVDGRNCFPPTALAHRSHNHRRPYEKNLELELSRVIGDFAFQ